MHTRLSSCRKRSTRAEKLQAVDSKNVLAHMGVSSFPALLIRHIQIHGGTIALRSGSFSPS